MKAVPDELATLLSQPEFREFHTPCGDKFEKDVKRFLTATMDEVRLTTSSRVALKVLETIGIGDSATFRDAVLRRELSGTIAYEKQRDHSSHTLYNYLLGWYFFAHSPKLNGALTSEFAKRGVPRASVELFQTNGSYFGSVWQYVSLLHDIGYMFEGGLSRMSFEDSSKQAEIGAFVARQHFGRTIWLDYKIDIIAERARLLENLGANLRPPAFARTGTLAEIADELRTIGNLEDLLPHVNLALDEVGVTEKPDLKDYSEDGFQLWAQHYAQFGNSGMERRILSLRKIFNGLIDVGLPDVNLRVLDHGVCGALLQLWASTYYYRLLARALCFKEPRLPVVQKIVDGGSWSPAFWWTGIVWATAAVGLHNIQQMSAAARLDPEWPGKLSLSDDPLAYLGILVDVIQEWNRYSVFKALDREPVQGIEVALGNEKGKILLRFDEPNGTTRAGKVVKELDQALEGWRELLEVGPR